MVYQKDYILRMIEMLGEFIAAVMGYLRKQQIPMARENLDNAWTELLHKEAAFFTSIPEENLTDTLLHQHHYEGGHLEIVAALFWLEAELRRTESGTDQAGPFYRKSLLIYEFLDLNSRTFSFERQTRMEEIRKILSG